MTAAEYMDEQSIIGKITKENGTMLVENKIR